MIAYHQCKAKYWRRADFQCWSWSSISEAFSLENTDGCKVSDGNVLRFFKFRNDSQKLEFYLVGMPQFCCETPLGEGFSSPGRRFGPEMSGTSAEPATSCVQHSPVTTETSMPFLGLTAKSGARASQATADSWSAGWKRNDFSAAFLRQRFGKYLTLSWYRAENIFSEIDYFFTCTSEKFTD